MPTVALSIPTTQMSARATTTATMVSNLNSTDAVPTGGAFTATNVDTYNAKSTVTVYDSQGNDHALDLYYVKTADNNWTVHAIDSTTGQAAGNFNMVFDTSGNLTSASTVALTIQGCERCCGQPQRARQPAAEHRQNQLR